jgi:hypothetical protein
LNHGVVPYVVLKWSPDARR